MADNLRDNIYGASDVTKIVQQHEDNIKDLKSSLADITYQAVTTVFNPDGSITESYASGLTKTITFSSDGSITEVYSAPINKTKTITFNSDGSISEVVV